MMRRYLKKLSVRNDFTFVLQILIDFEYNRFLEGLNCRAGYVTGRIMRHTILHQVVSVIRISIAKLNYICDVYLLV